MAPKPPQRFVKKVGAISSDWSRSVPDARGYPALGGAGWARIGQVAKHSKHHWVTGTLFSSDRSVGVRTWDHNVHLDVPILVVQRQMRYTFPDEIHKARSNGQVVINDLDDWFWGLHKSNAAYRLTDPKKNRISNIDHYKDVLLASDLVVVSTPFLAEQLSKWSDSLRIILIRNGVDVDYFSTRLQRQVDPVIGWAGSTAHRSDDLQLLKSVCAELPDATFAHTGWHPSAPQFHDEVGIEASRVLNTPMLAPHQYVHGLNFDIGLIPLTNIPFNQAKSNIKGLEYAAAGIPFIASPLPEYVYLAEELGIGRLASSSSDWVQHIAELQDADLRREEAKRQRALLTAHALDAKTQARAWDELIWSYP